MINVPVLLQAVWCRAVVFFFTKIFDVKRIEKCIYRAMGKESDTGLADPAIAIAIELAADTSTRCQCHQHAVPEIRKVLR